MNLALCRKHLPVTLSRLKNLIKVLGLEVSLNARPFGLFQFKPLEQLMGVFPAASGNFIPPTWRDLMSNPVIETSFCFIFTFCVWACFVREINPVRRAPSRSASVVRFAVVSILKSVQHWTAKWPTWPPRWPGVTRIMTVCSIHLSWPKLYVGSKTVRDNQPPFFVPPPPPPKSFCHFIVQD